MLRDVLPYAILRYIVDEETAEAEHKLPAIGRLAGRMHVSRGKLREELIAAEAYGIVEMRPGDGTYVLPFDFYTPVRTLVLYGIARDKKRFDRLYHLRSHLEAAFWDEAVRSLEREDVERLAEIVEAAVRRLKGRPIEVPHEEHREFHLRVFERLGNEFVQGLLRVYWDAYELVGLHRYFDYSYYEEMWSSHRAMVQAIADQRYDEGKEILIRHFTLLEDRLQRTG